MRLIDANNAISVLKILSDKCCDDNVFEQAISVLESVPTVDALSVVRCKDCKHHDDEEIGMVYCPKQIGGWVESDWFCADGERKHE